MKRNSKNKRNLLIVLSVAVLAAVYIFASSLGSLFSVSGSRSYDDAPRDSFAIINISGTIQASPSSPLDSYSYDHSRLMSYVDSLMEDEGNHGILLKVNSGGGTVYHSDEMYEKLLEYKEKTGRPIYAYFEQTAASGAYYISCAEDYISANRNCWTGSIGVIISYTNISGLYEKLGMEEIIISTGENKGMGSSASPLTDEQRRIYQSLVDESYERFVTIVALARKMDARDVLPLADGRVYTAKQAIENGLIDNVESYEEALARMEELTGVPGYEKVFTRSVSLLDYIFYSIQETMPKSDMESINELTSSRLQGVPLYYWQR